MSRTRVPLPPAVREPYRVFLNGVPQRPGSDFTARDRALEFPTDLRHDHISKKRWFLGAWGVGTYRQDDSVDVSWTGPDGAPRMAHRLPLEPMADGAAG